MNYADLPGYRRMQMRIMAMPQEAQARMRQAMSGLEADAAAKQGQREMWGQEFAAREKNRASDLDLREREMAARSALTRRRIDLAETDLSRQDAEGRAADSLGLIGLGVSGAIGYGRMRQQQEQAERLKRIADMYPGSALGFAPAG